MELFLFAILAIAAIQSFCKLALLPRIWELAAAVVAAVMVLCFRGYITKMSMATTLAAMLQFKTLENWCALVVVQELFATVAGLSLMYAFADDRVRDAAWWRRNWWKFASFLPSVLFLPGVFFLQMKLINRFPQYSPKSITAVLAVALPLALLAVAEFMRLWKRRGEARVLAVLHFEYLLIIPAIFLPTAAVAELAELPPQGNWKNSAALLAILAGATLVSALFFMILNAIKESKGKKCRI